MKLKPSSRRVLLTLRADGSRERAGSHRYWLRHEPAGLLPSVVEASAPASSHPAAEAHDGQLQLEGAR